LARNLEDRRINFSFAGFARIVCKISPACNAAIWFIFNALVDPRRKRRDIALRQVRLRHPEESEPFDNRPFYLILNG
jgi:hypothetical protein